MAPKRKRPQTRRTPPLHSASVHVEAQDLKATTTTTPIIARLGSEIGSTIIRLGSIGGALAAIVSVVVISANYTLPAVFRFWASDPAPFEGKGTHDADLEMRFRSVAQTIRETSEAASKAIQAADRAIAQAQLASLKEDNRDLCNLVDRLATINMRLRETPTDQFFIDAKNAREREIGVLRSRIQMGGMLPEC